MKTFFIARRKNHHFINSWDYVQFIDRPTKLTKICNAHSFPKAQNAFEALNTFHKSIKDSYHVVELDRFDKDFYTIQPVYN